MKIANVTNIDKNRNNIKNSFIDHQFEIFQYAMDGICIINATGKIEYVNEAYGRLFNVSNFAMIGKSIYHTHNDELLLKGLKNKTRMRGVIKVDNSCCVGAYITPLMDNNKFIGIMAAYREMEKEEVDDRQVVHLPSSKTETQIELSAPFKKMIGGSRLMKRALWSAEKAAKTNSTVLIRGESGTGKELVAKAIHHTSNRADNGFIRVNCGAIPSNLLESELFGHEQGAFTGAIKRKIGKFQQADEGTIFLDEIGDMPLEMQVKLLRLIQEKEFERVGGNETIKCDVRIIAATHRNLEEQILEGTFREDLYYRLNIVPVLLPALRERKEDIPQLCEHFIEKIARKNYCNAKIIEDSAIKALTQYNWPGNVRELENLIERLIVLSEGETITIDELPSNITNLYRANYHESNDDGLINLGKNGQMATLDQYEMEIIKYALQRFKSFNAAAKALGITHKTVAFKARKYNIVD
ncbi:sigma-54 interaction domain-containing protein [Alkaliphilus peptidifermentans]|uniref:HTH-type transcriptional regulatory protein TyrR n=1 Tax=Alkaliphilus peptidifermentans DSM 18978 TaxID=1120976 RepID=A0A1G5HTM2_9FIRM|nr:sigma 54-interacting transcriptional regulator [Alkaliphilus peptidifermentans]SCY67103.1 Transcriptional regulator containing PAS, AAA-type ATPase, and DNA-binding Fis domains [Alkaliphilus peptidifermentans DSM 18978]